MATPAFSCVAPVVVASPTSPTVDQGDFDDDENPDPAGAAGAAAGLALAGLVPGSGSRDHPPGDLSAAPQGEDLLTAYEKLAQLGLNRPHTPRRSVRRSRSQRGRSREPRRSPRRPHRRSRER